MKKLTLLLFLIGGCFAVSNAQNASVKGIITDTTNKEHLTNTVISLLHANDSILYKFTRSDKDGKFQLNHLTAGKYIMLVTHNTFADYVDELNLSDTSHLDLGEIKMTLEANLLQEVIVRQRIAAVRMKGDTLEFNADSFKVREGASTEEMLRKLPGIQVDKDGKITAQGEKIEKVLVDGEEFFGDDPTLATRNIPADAIDKVQVFDKKSDQAEFTGIDDGQKTKTLNLKLKADKKKGYFGKIDIGAGLYDRWNNTAMFNRFRAKQKFSVYGIMSSTGKTGLDWDERSTYGGGDNLEYDEDNGFFYMEGGGDEFSNSQYFGEGVPKSWSAGANYSNKFDDDKQNVNGSYRYNKLNNEGSGQTLTQNILPNSVLITNETRNTFGSRERHSLNGTYEWQIDSSTSIKLTANGYKGNQSGYTEYNSITKGAKGNLINNSNRNSSSSGDNSDFNARLLLKKRFKKLGRTLSLNLEDKYNDSKTKGYLYALITTYNDDIGRDSITDQMKMYNNSVASMSAKLTYTEPVAKNLFAELSYTIRNSKSEAERLSYDKNNEGKYLNFNDTFSNHYDFNVFTNAGGAALKYNSKKVTASAGTDIAFQNFKQTDLIADTTLRRDYRNFFPRANFTYKFNAASRLYIGYQGSTRQPTIQQIQPVADNSNPLFINIGNPELKQEFRHNINFNLNSYKVLEQRGYYLYGGFNTVSNAIVNNQETDSTGKTINQYINMNGNYNGYSGFGYNMKLKKLDMNLNFGLNYNTSRYSSVVNGLKNTTDNNAPGFRIGLYKYKEKKYNIYYDYSFNYNFSKSSVNNSLTTDYWTQSHNLGLNITLPWKFELNSDVDWNLRQKTDLFTNNNNVFLWNGYIGRKFLKNDKAMLRLNTYDILNQNKGFNRYINTNVIRENSYQTLRRYFTLSFVWNFSKTPAGGAAQ